MRVEKWRPRPVEYMAVAKLGGWALLGLPRWVGRRTGQVARALGVSTGQDAGGGRQALGRDKKLGKQSSAQERLMRDVGKEKAEGERTVGS